MSIDTLHAALAWLQAALGVAVGLGGLLIAATGVDAGSRRSTRWPLVGLVAWAAWFALAGLRHGHDSPPAMAFAGLLAYVLLRYGRQVRGILDRERWWPPEAARRAAIINRKMALHRRRRTVPWWRKLNPWWLLAANEDDGYWGDASWNPARERTLRTAVRWWLRNPAHNLTWYALGVADLDRLVVGPWGDQAIDHPGLCWHVVRVARLRLPFIAYNGRYVVAYIGWRPSGAFGLKLRRERPAMEVHP